MKDRTEIFGCRTKRDKAHAGRNRVFGIFKQLLADPAIAILRFNVQLVDLEIFGSGFIDTGILPGSYVVTEQISADQIAVCCDKDSFSFEFVRIVFAISVTRIFLLPIF